MIKKLKFGLIILLLMGAGCDSPSPSEIAGALYFKEYNTILHSTSTIKWSCASQKTLNQYKNRVEIVSCAGKDVYYFRERDGEFFDPVALIEIKKLWPLYDLH
ncbi:MAG: hypothetical protein AABY22_06650 [Nanoarchaeota archaeon]